MLSWYVRYLMQADMFRVPVSSWRMACFRCLFLSGFLPAPLMHFCFALMGIIISIIVQAEINHFSLLSACSALWLYRFFFAIMGRKWWQSSYTVKYTYNPAAEDKQLDTMAFVFVLEKLNIYSVQHSDVFKGERRCFCVVMPIFFFIIFFEWNTVAP